MLDILFIKAKHTPTTLRNDTIDSVTHLCKIKLITRNFLLINEKDMHRGHPSGYSIIKTITFLKNDLD